MRRQKIRSIAVILRATLAELIERIDQERDLGAVEEITWLAQKLESFLKENPGEEPGQMS